jgi:GT2 family glycosyltransferase
LFLVTPSVAIVILNWNGRDFLRQFIPSVLKTTYPNYQLVVADNASTDDSLSFLHENFPSVSILRLTNNYGFAKGYNVALKQVEADYYLLLNSDVEVTPGWLEPLVDCAEADKRRGAVQPKILSFHQRQLFEYAGGAGGWIDQYGYPFARGRVFEVCEEDQGQYDSSSAIFWASGAALLIRSSVYHELEGFDEFLFAHQEEIDLCWRLQLAGYSIWSCPQSVVYHVGGGTLPKGNSRKTFLNFRNNQVILAKNLPWSEKWWKIPFRMALDQISAVKSLLGGDFGYFRAVIRAHLAFIAWIFRGPKKIFKGKKRKLSSLSGVYPGCIVWDYFVRKKKTFQEIVGKNV